MRALSALSALLLAGCSIITSLDGYTFVDTDAGQDAGTVRDAGSVDAGPVDAGPFDAGPCGVCQDPTPVCEPTTGACVECRDGHDEDCGDRDPCTVDRCSLGRCAYTAVTCTNELALGYQHTCARRGGQVYCWGENTGGVLGDGSSGGGAQLSPVRTSGISDAAQLGAGYRTMCVRRTSGSVACWGNNDWGQLGDGTTLPRLTPVAVVGLTDALHLSVGTNAVGDDEVHACAARSNGEIVCWGHNGSGELGDGSIIDRYQPVTVLDISDAMQVAAGSEHTCALRENRTVACWGRGFGATPTLVDGWSEIDQIAAGGDRTCARRTDGQVLCLSEDLSALTDAIHISVSRSHACAVRRAGAVVCWGANSSGQLGDGTTTSSATPLTVRDLLDADLLPVRLGGSVGIGHSCARRVTGDVVCWGGNGFGQLGDGTMTDRLTPVPVMGL